MGTVMRSRWAGFLVLAVLALALVASVAAGTAHAAPTNAVYSGSATAQTGEKVSFKLVDDGSSLKVTGVGSSFDTSAVYASLVYPDTACTQPEGTNDPSTVGGVWDPRGQTSQSVAATYTGNPYKTVSGNIKAVSLRKVNTVTIAANGAVTGPATITAAPVVCVPVTLVAGDPDPGTSTSTTPTTTTSTGTVGTAGDDKDCNDFATQAEAQRYLQDHATSTNPDPSHLDANGNGKACEDAADGSGKVVTGATSTVTKAPTTTVAPTTVTPLTLGNAGGSTTGSTTGPGSSNSQVSVVPDTSNGVDTGGWDW